MPKRTSLCPLGIVLPHQQEIERMSSFREQLGEDWLRYQHHLEGAVSRPATQAQPVPNGLGTADSPPPSPEATEALLPPPPSSEPQPEEEQETESTLQWPGHASRPTESTLEGDCGASASASWQSAESQASAREESVDVKEEENEEEDLGGADKNLKNTKMMRNMSNQLDRDKTFLQNSEE